MAPQVRVDDSLKVQGRVAAPLREQTLEILRGAILDGRFKPGQRLIERELIELLGVSRTTVREVLRSLTSEGLIAAIPHHGSVVISADADEASDLYEVRAALETLAARWFVERASDEQIEELREAVEQFREVAGGTDINAMLRAKKLFYDVLLEGSGSDAIEQMLSSVQARTRLLRAASLSQPGRPAASLRELEAIVEAISDRDAELAAQLAAGHLRKAGTAGLAGLTALAGAEQGGSPAPSGA